MKETLKKIGPLYFVYSGLKYLHFRYQLAQSNKFDRVEDAKHLGLPVPPARLRHRVHGSLDRVSYLAVGESVGHSLRQLCHRVGRELYSFESILDFGCGSGRVLRSFGDAPEQCQFYGTDIDAELVDWCKNHLTHIRWATNKFEPPLEYADETFDLIYAISVFTHLDEELQFRWLEELKRVVKPGGLLILTTHGEEFLSKKSSEIQRVVQENGFYYMVETTGKFKLDGLPDFYQTAYHSKDYILNNWSRYFEIVEYVDRGVNNHQDAVLLRRV